MGRDSWSDRLAVEECKTIDIPWLAKYDYFCGYRSGLITWKNSFGEQTGSIAIQVTVDNEMFRGNYVRFMSTMTDHSTGEKTEIDYKVDLVTTSCNYGGVRYWFICPLTVNQRVCDKRVSKLYLPPGGKYFGCRICHNLTYRSCKEHDKRVDALLKNPALLHATLSDKDFSKSLLGVKASLKLLFPK